MCGGENKKYSRVGFWVGCRFNCPVTLCLFLSFILAVSSFRLAGNLFIGVPPLKVHIFNSNVL